jgi:hypothetical protein
MQKKTSGDLFFLQRKSYDALLFFLHEITPTGRPIIINFPSSDKTKKYKKSPGLSSQSHFLSLFVYLFCVWSTFPRISCHLPSNSNIFQNKKTKKQNRKFLLTEFSVITVNVINIFRKSPQKKIKKKKRPLKRHAIVSRAQVVLRWMDTRTQVFKRQEKYGKGRRKWPPTKRP